jgi:hypothetical protein
MCWKGDFQLDKSLDRPNNDSEKENNDGDFVDSMHHP